MPAYPYLTPKEAFPQAKAAAQRSIEIDPTLAEGHTFLAFSFAVYDWNWAEAEREFKRAIELDPNNSPARFRYGQIYLAPLGRSDEAVTEVKTALEIEPLDLNMGGNLAWVYQSARQYDRALEQGRKTYELEPSFITARWNFSQAYIVNGMYAEATALSEKSLEAYPTNQFMLQAAGYATQSRVADARQKESSRDSKT
jgi:tetratricopeptide (TPR) repeat protein